MTSGFFSAAISDECSLNAAQNKSIKNKISPSRLIGEGEAGGDGEREADELPMESDNSGDFSSVSLLLSTSGFLVSSAIVVVAQQGRV